MPSATTILAFVQGTAWAKAGGDDAIHEMLTLRVHCTRIPNAGRAALPCLFSRGDEMNLTREERHRFATWCEAQAADAAAIVEQLKKLGPHGDIVAQREKQEAAAALLIAAKLRAIEEASIGD